MRLVVFGFAYTVIGALVLMGITPVFGFELQSYSFMAGSIYGALCVFLMAAFRL